MQNTRKALRMADSNKNICVKFLFIKPRVTHEVNGGELMEGVITIMVLLMMLGLYFLLLSDYKKTNEKIDDYNRSLFRLAQSLKEIAEIIQENNKVNQPQAEATVTTTEDTEVNNDIYNKIMTEWLGVNPIEEGDVNATGEDDNNISSSY